MFELPSKRNPLFLLRRNSNACCVFSNVSIDCSFRVRQIICCYSMTGKNGSPRRSFTMGNLVTATTVLGLWINLVHGSVLQEKITLLKDTNDDYRNVVVVTWKDEGGNDIQCQMFTDQKLIREVLRTSVETSIHRPTKEMMLEIEEECNSFSQNRWRREIAEDEDENATLQEGPGSTQSPFAWIAIFPGTKWCGKGNIAKHEDDLGLHENTDRCCRAHDNCDDFILARETKYNLTNTTPFTKLSCKCDNNFYDCLTQINNKISSTIGKTYFNILKNSCFVKDYPLSKTCKKYKTLLNLTCVEYEKDIEKPKVYQWVKAKLFKKNINSGSLTVNEDNQWSTSNGTSLNVPC